MKIEWNEVTWYSWVVAVIVFGGAFAIGIFLGMQIQAKSDLGTMRHAMPAPTQQAMNMHMGSSTPTITYSCDEGKKIQATYSDKQVHIMTSDGTDLTLPQAISADGGRYANSNESFVFWTKGNGAFVMQTVSGTSTTTYANCTQTASQVK